MRPVERVAAAFARARGLPPEVEEQLVALLRREREDALAALVPASQLADFRALGESEPATGTPAPPPRDGSAGDARYEPLIPLGAGGMGEVWRVRDRSLDRTVAMKILKPELTPNPSAVQQFEAEVRLTARLQHPNILPVYDVGRRADGRAWYTMREASGRTLDALRVADSARPPAELRRLVGALRQACAAVAYAHEAGIIHGDLKPANLMVGPFGDVVVLDWGLARTRSAGAAGARGGTPGYLPPEWVSADGPDPLGDVYALGATLWELVTGRRLRTSDAAGRLWEDRHAAHLPGVPDEADGLARIALEALAPAPDRRTPSAQALGTSLDDWLEGVVEQDRARVFVGHARERLPEMERLRAEAERLTVDAARLRDAVPTWAPLGDKRPAWLLEDEAVAHTRNATLLEVSHVEELRAALTRAPDLVEARDLLADHYQRLHAAAERRRDRIGAEAYEQLLRRHDRGRHAAWLAGTGWLSLRTEPPCQATLHRFESQDRRLVPVEVGPLGTTPLERLPLPHGSYLVELTAAGHLPVSYPVRIDRGGHWDGVAPPRSADDTPDVEAIPLPRDGDLGPDDVYIPAGWFRSGDPDARNGLPLRDVWVDTFVLRRHPVTNGEYVAFLNDLVAQGRAAEAAVHVPRGSDRTRDPAGVPVFPQEPGDPPRYFVGADPEGDVLDPDWPVVLVSWDSARAFAAWEAERTGLPWRLPWELEREKATRGVDGRLYPWGDYPEPTWSHNGQAQKGRALPARVQDARFDRSPYGVCGGAGNVRDRCLDRARAVGPALTAGGRFVPPDGQALDLDAPLLDRGGAWSAGIAYGRVGQRLWSPPGFRNSLIGFRLACSYVPAATWAEPATGRSPRTAGDRSPGARSTGPAGR